MSRIGNQIIEIPDKVTVENKDGFIMARGPAGEHTIELPENINIDIKEKEITVSRTNDEKFVKSNHGMFRSLLFNAVEGANNGFSKTLLIEGVGFRAELKGKRLLLNLGFSHPILIIPPEGIEFKVPNQTTVEVHGSSKQLVGEVASKLKHLRPPEPYKGKGIRYEGEYIRRKAGKAAAAT